MNTSVIHFLKSERLFTWAACSIAAGVFFSHFPLLMSGGAVAIALNGLLQPQVSKVFKDKFFLAASSLFLLMLVSLPYTHNTHEWGLETQRKLSFILIALGVAANKERIDSHKINLVLLSFLTAVIPVGLLTVGNYFSDFTYYNQKILESQGLPIISGISHISFSIFCSFAIGICIYFYKNPPLIHQALFLQKKYIYAIIGIILFIIFHIISSRTGWVALYSGLLCLIGIEIKRSGKYIAGLVSLLLLCTIPIIAFYLSTSFHNKIINTYEDISRYFNGEYIGFYSVSMRFEAWRACFKLFMEHPFFGVSSADLGEMMQQQYDLMHTSGYARVYEAHNQFLEYAACNGIIGLACILFLYIFPFTKISISHPLTPFFLTSTAAALMFESFLEIQVGIAFFTLFYMLLNSWKAKG